VHRDCGPLLRQRVLDPGSVVPRLVLSLAGICRAPLALPIGRAVPWLGVTRMKSVRASSRLSSSWSALLLALVVAAVALALYLPTLAPTITWHNNGADSGDLATAVVTLGIAHPPGYPTYVLLGRAWLALPFGGDPAFRLNLMSAASAALAASLTTVAVLVLGRRLGASGVPLALGAVWSGLALASAPLPWASAVIGEKFAPGLALVSLISLLVLRWQTPLPPRGPALVALLGGLGLGLLPQVALAAPGVLGVLVARAGKAALHPGYWLPIGFAAIVGLSVFLYLPWRAAANPLANWGDPGTPERFWAHVAARQYYTHFFDAGPREWLARLGEGGLLVAQNLTWIGVGLAALGVYLLWRSDRAALWYLGTLIALTVLVRTSYSTYRDVMYLLPALQALTILVGLGAPPPARCWPSWPCARWQPRRASTPAVTGAPTTRPGRYSRRCRRTRSWSQGSTSSPSASGTARRWASAATSW
jgi:hypothetical protein